jgi:hypothetical protein
VGVGTYKIEEHPFGSVLVKSEASRSFLGALNSDLRFSHLCKYLKKYSMEGEPAVYKVLLINIYFVKNQARKRELMCSCSETLTMLSSVQ